MAWAVHAKVNTHIRVSTYLMAPIPLEYHGTTLHLSK